MRKSIRWMEPSSEAESIDFCREIALTHALRGGPIGKKIAALIKADDLAGLCKFEFTYDVATVLGTDIADLAAQVAGADCSLEAAVRDDLVLRGTYISYVRECRQALAFFQKLTFARIGEDKEGNALTKFLEAEKACLESNQAIRAERRGDFFFSSEASGVFHAAQQKIVRVLGRCPSLSELRYRFGPGATVRTPKRKASIRAKIAEGATCSEELFPVVKYVLEELPHLATAQSSLEISDSGDLEDCRVERSFVDVGLEPARLNFVPKNAKTYRTVLVGPGLNVLVELAYGDWMSKRLALFGLDTRNQSINQDRARVGSLTGALATLDLVSASDMLSRELVGVLLPLDWYIALSRARTSAVRMPDGTLLHQEKFSAMGNGFTFPLQTLIFWALAASCCSKESDATVYGDDIVVPSEVAPLVTRVLHAAGFTVNTLKSYSTGPFRESCGKDYVWGIDVRPYYQKDLVSPQSLFVLHNYYVRRGDQERALRVESYIHPSLRTYGPDGYGDGHLIREGVSLLSQKYRDRGYGGSFFSTYTNTTGSDEKSKGPDVEYALALYSAYVSGSDEDFLAKVDRNRSRPPSQSAMLERYFKRGIGARGPRSLPLAGEEVKKLPLPEVTGYKKIKIYKFD